MKNYGVRVADGADVCECGHVRIGHGDRAIGGVCIGETAIVSFGIATYQVLSGVYCQCKGFKHAEEADP